MKTSSRRRDFTGNYRHRISYIKISQRDRKRVHDPGETSSFRISYKLYEGGGVDLRTNARFPKYGKSNNVKFTVDSYPVDLSVLYMRLHT